MVVDLGAHGLGLAGDQLGQGPGRAGRLGQHHRERRLQGMGQVADVGALALDDLLVVGDEGVQLQGQGLQLGRIAARHPLGAALAHLHDLAPEVEQRLQADAHLQDHRGDQQRAGQHQKGCGAQGEVAHVPIHGRAVLADHEHHRRLAPRQSSGQGDHVQRLALRSLGVIVDRRSQRQRAEVRRPGQLAVPQGSGARVGQGVQPPASDFRELPVLARIDPVGARAGEVGRIDLALLHARAGVEAVGDVLQPIVETGQRGGIEDEGQKAQGDGQDHQAPGRGQPDKPADQGGALAALPRLEGQFHASAASPVSGQSR